MSIQSEINRIQGAVADAYTSVAGKGGTISTSSTIANLPTAIDSIPQGEDCNATVSDLRSGKTAMVNGTIITGNMVDAEIEAYGAIQSVTDHIATVQYAYTVRAGGFAEEDTTDGDTFQVSISDLGYSMQEKEITPSMEDQIVVADSGKLLAKVKVNKIPSNYGLITWNGTNLIIS